jgi:hypothetical protein
MYPFKPKTETDKTKTMKVTHNALRILRTNPAFTISGIVAYPLIKNNGTGRGPEVY